MRWADSLLLSFYKVVASVVVVGERRLQITGASWWLFRGFRVPHGWCLWGGQNFTASPVGHGPPIKSCIIGDACSEHAGEFARVCRADSLRFSCSKKCGFPHSAGLHRGVAECLVLCYLCGVVSCFMFSYLVLLSICFPFPRRKPMRAYCAYPTPYMSGAGWDGCFLGGQT